MHAAHARRRRKARAERVRVMDSYPSTVTCDFRDVEDSTLRRYIREYAVDGTDSTSRDELASTVATHFNDELDADEDEVIPRFVKFMMNYNGGNDANVLAKQKAQQKKTRKRNRRPDTESEDEEEQVLYCVCKRPSYGEMIACDNKKCAIEWFHVSCVNMDPSKLNRGKWFCPDCAGAKARDRAAAAKAAVAASQGRKRSRKPVVSASGDDPPTTYSGMIARALRQFPKQRASFDDICSMIERNNPHTLNRKMESGMQKPVWKSSVRKILFSNNKFKRINGATFGFAG